MRRHRSDVGNFPSHIRIGETELLTSTSIATKKILTGSDDQDTTVGLGGASDHVLDEITMAGGINDGNVVFGSLELPQGNIDGDTTLTLGLELVQHPGILEGALAHLRIKNYFESLIRIGSGLMNYSETALNPDIIQGIKEPYPCGWIRIRIKIKLKELHNPAVHGTIQVQKDCTILLFFVHLLIFHK
jgi:hypothetical protein